VQSVRDIFDIMPKETTEDWGTITCRLRAVGPALQQYAESLAHSVTHGAAPARRQVERVAEPGAAQAGEASPHDALLPEARDQGASARTELAAAVEEAKQAFDTLGHYLRTELLPHAAASDAA